jgi:hypothetical protein
MGQPGIHPTKGEAKKLMALMASLRDKAKNKGKKK